MLQRFEICPALSVTLWVVLAVLVSVSSFKVHVQSTVQKAKMNTRLIADPTSHRCHANLYGCIDGGIVLRVGDRETTFKFSIAVCEFITAFS